jgi:hypothetical protein
MITVLAMAVATSRIAFGADDQMQRSGRDLGDMPEFLSLVAARGLADGAMPDPRASEHIPLPKAGANVAESVVTLRKTGERVVKAIVWSEPVDHGSLEFQEALAPTGLTGVQYFIISADGRRCVLMAQAAYGKDGRLLSSSFWRNDPEMRTAGSPDFPSNIFPNLGFPVSAILRALDAPEVGATGTLNMMMGPYGYMTFDLWGQDIEPTTVRAGTFQTLRVIMRINADSVMKDWPALMKKLAQPFLPKNVFYFDTVPPHHLVKFIGAFGYPAPEVTVEMTRAYVAGQSAPSR